MSWDDLFFLPHRVSIRARKGASGLGSGFAPAVSARAEVKDQVRLVRNPAGAEVVSSSQVTVPLEPAIPVGSKVTVWPGQPHSREAEVLAVSTDDNTDDSDLDSFQILYLT